MSEKVVSDKKSMRYWIGVASKNHVQRGIAGGFAQLGHGKPNALKRMAVGDWLIYYSSKLTLEGQAPCQEFTAIGQVVGEEVYPVSMAAGFTPYRRDLRYEKNKDAPIRPLIDKLAFIKDKQKWGYQFRFGHFEIEQGDFELIARSMLDKVP